MGIEMANVSPIFAASADGRALGTDSNAPPVGKKTDANDNLQSSLQFSL
jgi:hypothetical protein